MSDPVSLAFGAAITPPEEAKPARRRRAPAANLTDEVTALAQSLGVQAVNVDGTATYKPKGFITAIKRVHDALLAVQEDLVARQAALEAAEAALEARELAIQAREEQQAAFDALTELVAFRAPPRPRKRLFGLFGEAQQ
jgi:hypothetical protein